MSRQSGPYCKRNGEKHFLSNKIFFRLFVSYFVSDTICALLDLCTTATSPAVWNSAICLSLRSPWMAGGWLVWIGQHPARSPWVAGGWLVWTGQWLRPQLQVDVLLTCDQRAPWPDSSQGEVRKCQGPLKLSDVSYMPARRGSTFGFLPMFCLLKQLRRPFQHSQPSRCSRHRDGVGVQYVSGC